MGAPCLALQYVRTCYCRDPPRLSRFPVKEACRQPCGAVRSPHCLSTTPLTEATWEDADEFGWRFPQFHLEDKVDFMDGALSRTE